MDEIVDPLVQIQLPALLGEVADLDGGAHLHIAAVGGKLAGDHVKQCGFACAVAAYNADSVFPEEVIGEIINDGPAIVGFGNVVEFDDLPAQAAGCRCHLDGVVGLRGVLV